MAGDSREEIARDIEAVRRIAAVPTLLQVLCDTTGMGFAAVARVTEESWTACAVQDNIKFGLASGGQLDVQSTLCIESRRANLPIVIDQASTDERYRGHHTPRTYNIESYVSVPIVLKDGRYFGNLCAIDPRPAQVSDPRIMSMFSRFAHLIALQLDSEIERDHVQSRIARCPRRRRIARAIHRHTGARSSQPVAGGVRRMRVAVAAGGGSCRAHGDRTV